MTVLQKILKDSNYKLTQFTDEQILQLEQSVKFKDDKKGNAIPYGVCRVRQKEIKLTPEEIVRQLFLILLHTDYGYAYERIELEYAVTFGREKKRADIVVFDRIDSRAVYIIVEIKKPKLKDGKEQLHSYCNATGAPIGVWSNGESISYYHRKDPNYFEYLPGIPKATQKLSELLHEPWTLEDLIKNDRLVTEKKSLKDLVLEMEDEVLANAGVDVFEELFKLIFTKLYDEMESGRNRTRYLEFRNHGDTETELKDKIQKLFNRANDKWQGVFPEGTKLMLSSSHLAICISSLEKVKLFNSNLDVVDEAFEYLINKSSKGEKGQYFTPRYGIDMCVKMLNPKEYETMIDTAAGSCGFPVHTFFYVKSQIHKEEGLDDEDMMTTKPPIPRVLDYVQNNVFAIDFDEKAVRVARCLNLIAGDGQTNVLHLNTLDYERWNEKTKDEDWLDTYSNGWKNLRKHRKIKTETKENEAYINRDFQFDILMANPPFAGDIKESRMLAKYELGKKTTGKYQTSVGRDILFIERNLDFLKPGGRLAIILPQGRFNNSSDKAIREFIAEHCRILGVVGFHGNFFKPHTGTKTSVLLAQKWNDDPKAGPLCPRKDDYSIFFGTMQEPSKDNSGEKIYVRKKDYPQKAKLTEVIQEVAEPVNIYNETSPDIDEYLLDRHGHLIVKHDLFNHDGLTQDGIAEAFIEFAKKEHLSFF